MVTWCSIGGFKFSCRVIYINFWNCCRLGTNKLACDRQVEDARAAMALYQLVKEAWEASLRYRKDSSTAHVIDKKSSKVAKWCSLDKHSFACLQRMVHSTCMMDIARPSLQSSTHQAALYPSFYVWDSSTICFSTNQDLQFTSYCLVKYPYPSAIKNCKILII